MAKKIYFGSRRPRSKLFNVDSLAGQVPQVGPINGATAQSIPKKVVSETEPVDIRRLLDVSSKTNSKKKSTVKKGEECLCRRCRTPIPGDRGPYCDPCRIFVQSRRDMELGVSHVYTGPKGQLREGRDRTGVIKGIE